MNRILLRGIQVVNKLGGKMFHVEHWREVLRILLLTSVMIGGTEALLLGFGLFHVLAGFGRSIPMRARAMINAALGVDPDTNLGVALQFIRRCRSRRRLRLCWWR